MTRHGVDEAEEVAARLAKLDVGIEGIQLRVLRVRQSTEIILARLVRRMMDGKI